MQGDPYQILGVTRTTSPDDIKKKYKSLVKQYHPDVNPQYKEKFEQIQWAYDTIKSGGVTPNYNYQHVNVDDFFSAFKRPSFQMKNVKVGAKLALADIVHKREVTISFFDKKTHYVNFVPTSLEPIQIRLTIDGVMYMIQVNPELSDEGFKYDSGKLIKEVKLSAKEFMDLNTIDVDTVTSTVRLHLKQGTTTSQMMKINGAGLNGQPLYVNIVVYK